MHKNKLLIDGTFYESTKSKLYVTKTFVDYVSVVAQSQHFTMHESKLRKLVAYTQTNIREEEEDMVLAMLFSIHNTGRHTKISELSDVIFDWTRSNIKY